MKNIAFACLSALALSNFGAFRTTHAQEAAPGSAQVTLTSESLESTLVGLGYEPKRNSEGRLIIEVDRNGLILYPTLGIDPTGRLLMRVSVASVPHNSDATASVLHSLLEANDRIAPAYFQYDPTTRQIQLALSRSNAGLTPARLRSEIDAFDELARSTYDIWGRDAFRRLHPASPSVSAEAFRKIAGTYRLCEGTMFDGVAASAEQLAAAKVRLESGSLRVVGSNLAIGMVFDPENAPGAVDVFVSESASPQLGRYRLEGELLTIHIAYLNADRPESGAAAGSKDTLLVCRRIP